MLDKLLAVVTSYIDVYTVGIAVGVWWLTHYLKWKGLLFSGDVERPYGIYGFPLIGAVPYFLFGKKTVLEIVEDYAKRYGSVIRFKSGTSTVTVVSGAKAIREGMLNDDLLGRQKGEDKDSAMQKAFRLDSVLTLENDLWKKHRRFSLITLRDLGFGKTPKMEEQIQEEIRELSDLIEGQNGQPIDVNEMLLASTQNNVNTLIYGERLSFDSERRKELHTVISGLAKESQNIIYVAFVPKLIDVMYRFRLGCIGRMTVFVEQFKKLIKDRLDDHRANLDKDNPKDYLDHFLLEQQKDEDFTEELVGGNAMAFFSAGGSTVQVTVEYLLQLMAHYPEVQKKVQAEIDEITGRSRGVTWADSPQMTYTMAVIAERHRYFSVTPLGVPRRALRATKLNGYDIGALDTVIFNMDSINYDPELFEKPYEFRPERFIDAQGKLVNTEKVWTFSIGKRACPGESLAVLEVFLYFTMLLQNFDIVADEPIKFNRQRGLQTEAVKQPMRFVKRQ